MTAIEQENLEYLQEMCNVMNMKESEAGLSLFSEVDLSLFYEFMGGVGLESEVLSCANHKLVAKVGSSTYVVEYIITPDGTRYEWQSRLAITWP